MFGQDSGGANLMQSKLSYILNSKYVWGAFPKIVTVSGLFSSADALCSEYEVPFVAYILQIISIALPLSYNSVIMHCCLG